MEIKITVGLAIGNVTVFTSHMHFIWFESDRFGRKSNIRALLFLGEFLCSADPYLVMMVGTTGAVPVSAAITGGFAMLLVVEVSTEYAICGS